ncbi:Predicted transcriptional regulators containing the CopG/Arc/MetJ DNA-binding domain [Bordetella ansorpii]|uniref:Predicted transcriptional regulators containing the CopG/Arc/MetJ DNA-binding domain n=1 Tax=Bordetella ansorpii TaxID=288768 RepID=A0A157SB52_9BORD|nr:ribbon-helix-helix domain-containing protein [Bordetella ansorpii]SAI67670.1 Predicted transcriptional regulators containing the CopG/Arc/MetJ DNA-binding domain [Bordetella ansorpii]
MSTTLERLTITMPPEMAASIKQTVDEGDYASTSEVVREAVREWKIRRELMLNELTAIYWRSGRTLHAHHPNRSPASSSESC